MKRYIWYIAIFGTLTYMGMGNLSDCTTQNSLHTIQTQNAYIDRYQRKKDSLDRLRDKEIIQHLREMDSRKTDSLKFLTQINALLLETNEALLQRKALDKIILRSQEQFKEQQRAILDSLTAETTRRIQVMEGVNDSTLKVLISSKKYSGTYQQKDRWIEYTAKLEDSLSIQTQAVRSEPTYVATYVKGKKIPFLSKRRDYVQLSIVEQNPYIVPKKSQMQITVSEKISLPKLKKNKHKSKRPKKSARVRNRSDN